jgi:transcriptional regulator with XRE-family HTH domain
VTTLTKKKLLDDLKDKETRDIFVEEHIATGLPFQIHALREKLGLTQTELARRAGMAQERISKLEDPNYEFIPKIPTLLKLASVFDVPLIVKFGSWTELFNWETQLSPDDLAPATFDEEVGALEDAATSVWHTSVPVRVLSFHTAKSIPWSYELDEGAIVTSFEVQRPLFQVAQPVYYGWPSEPFSAIPIPRLVTTEDLLQTDSVM